MRRIAPLVCLLIVAALTVVGDQRQTSPRFQGTELPGPQRQQRPGKPPETTLPKALVTVASVGERPRTSPLFQGMELPPPPQQQRPWKPAETKLPNALVTATAALFAAGLADPRGCEYRVLEVGTGDCSSGDAGPFQTHGWVLPARPGAKQHFAVCWNGLVYPLVSAGKKSDMQADIRAVLKADEEARTQYARENPKHPFYRSRHAWPEQHSVSHQTLLPLKACLLLRLGEEPLARGVWNAWIVGMRPGTNDDAVHLRDPYLMLATDWTWALFDRTVCAHMRSDDQLALLGARTLDHLQTVVEAEADNRRIERRERIGKNGPEPQPHLNFLEQLPELLADQQRRAKEGKREHFFPPESSKAQRIAGHIRDLENLSAPQLSQPGGVSLEFGLAGLIEEGDEAVEPLINCLEEDTRLTRSVSFHRDFFHHRCIHGTHEAAYVALCGILKADFGHDLRDRRKVAEEVRKHWKRFKSVPLEERWYRILKDDTVSVAEWLKAAENIGELLRAPRGKAAEALRKKSDPPVTELLSRRIESLGKRVEPDVKYRDNLSSACQLAYVLAAWEPDPTKSLTRVLGELMRRCRQYMAEEKQADGNTFSVLGPAIARLTQLRCKAGDSSALGQYAGWIRSAEPRHASHSFKDVLEPMWQHPDDPDIAAAAEAMFNGERSPWTKRFLRSFNTNDLFGTPMIGLAGFRKRLLAELADKRTAGTLKVNEEGYGYLEVDGGWSGGPAIHSRGDPLAPKPGTSVVFRVCDFYAWGVSATAGAPRCQLYWPEAERDKAVAACAAFLKRYR